jgi:dipeptidyl aminopeptidase/acylaminoacyl peptidase
VLENWKRFMAELAGGWEKEQEFLLRKSSISHVNNTRKIRSGLLVIQGANDPRLVKNESDQIVERLHNNLTNVEDLIFEDERHGFTKYSSLLKALKMSAELTVSNLACS